MDKPGRRVVLPRPRPPGPPVVVVALVGFIVGFIFLSLPGGVIGAFVALHLVRRWRERREREVLEEEAQ